MTTLVSKVILNGRLIPQERARISPLGSGFLFGRGLFETVKVSRGRAIFLIDHLARLEMSARELDIGLRAAPNALAALCQRLIRATGLREGNLKIVAFDGAKGPEDLILARRSRRYLPADYARGFRLGVARGDRPAHGITRFKSLNFLANINERRFAEAAGFDDSLFVSSRGEVIESTRANIFAVFDREIATPPLSAAILPGITRHRVAYLARKRGRFDDRRPLTLKKLLGAREVFVTNALLGIMPVSQIDNHRYNVRRNPVTRELAAAYRAIEAEDFAQARTLPARKSIAGG